MFLIIVCVIGAAVLAAMVVNAFVEHRRFNKWLEEFDDRQRIRRAVDLLSDEEWEERFR